MFADIYIVANGEAEIRMNLYENLRLVMQKVENPTVGLPEEVFEFVSSVTPMINVDLLIRDEQGRILLARRNDKFDGWVWHIPGGIVRFKETFLHRIDQVAKKEIGQPVYTNAVPLEVNEIFSDHRERGHFISFLYLCELTKALELIEKEEWQDGDLKWFASCPDDFILCQKNVYQKYFGENYEQTIMQAL